MVRLLALLLLAPAEAALPMNTFPQCGEPGRPDLCPSDLGVDWAHISWVPPVSEETIRPAERALGSGIWLDRAFRTTAGRWDVLLALGDSGVDWSRGDLTRKYFLNAGELPVPQAADGTPAAGHDANGDGMFNMDDYAADPRLDPTAGQDRADGILDPSDLIATFSDGVDDDGNGYTDDISGWDFFGRDNDPYHSLETSYGEHGDGVAREMAAEGDNGGSIGVCPNCPLLPLRTGDAFIIDSTRVAEAVAYAADMGARGMSLALGGITSPDMARSAFRYAFDQGLVIAAVAGDENSYHHNLPAMLEDALYVHSIRHNTNNDDEAAYSYFNTWNCNNFGLRMDVVASSHACATGSAAVTAALAGLIVSAGRDNGYELSAGEVSALIKTTTDDIHLSAEERAISNAYPSTEGWDSFYGYGRVNAARAVEAAAAGEIPPWAAIDAPRWFDVVDPRVTPRVPVEARLSGLRAGSFSWSLEVATGSEPSDWEEIATGSGSGEQSGPIAEVDLTRIPWSPVPGPTAEETLLDRIERVHAGAVTLRLRVEDDAGRQSEARKSFFIDRDPALLDGFPIFLGASGESGPVLADLDGDGVYEIVVGTADGKVFAFFGDGTPVDGWPFVLPPLDDAPLTSPALQSGAVPPSPDAIVAPVAVGDLDGDGSPEVVVTSYFGSIQAIHADGTPVAGFPVRTLGRDPAEWSGRLFNFDQGFMAAPALWDIDGDGRLEIIASAMDGRLYVVDHRGEPWGPYPVDLCYPSICGIEGYRSISSPAVGDVDGDGDADVYVGTNEAVEERFAVTHALDLESATALPGWPRLDMGLIGQAVLLPLIGEGHPSSVSFADLDGNGDLELMNPVMLGTTPLLNHDGSEYLSVPYYAEDYGPDNNVNENELPAFIQMVTHPAFGDLDGDGVDDLVLGGAGNKYLVGLFLSEYVEYQHPLGAWSGKGDGAGKAPFLPGFPQQIEDLQLMLGASIADVSGDGKPEAIYASGGYMVYAWDAEGDLAPGFPHFTGGWLIGTPTVGDIDGDGYLDVVAVTREGWLFAWRTEGPADVPPEWVGLRHDTWNTGNATVALDAQAGPPPVEGEDDKGCGCRGDDSSAALVLLLPFGLWGRRRRR